MREKTGLSIHFVCPIFIPIFNCSDIPWQSWSDYDEHIYDDGGWWAHIVHHHHHHHKHQMRYGQTCQLLADWELSSFDWAVLYLPSPKTGIIVIININENIIIFVIIVFDNCHRLSYHYYHPHRHQQQYIEHSGMRRWALINCRQEELELLQDTGTPWTLGL